MWIFFLFALLNSFLQDKHQLCPSIHTSSVSCRIVVVKICATKLLPNTVKNPYKPFSGSDKMSSFHRSPCQ